MKTKKSMSAVVLFGFLVLSSCDKKNAFLVNRRTATPEKIEEAKKRKEDEERARVKAKEKADADTRRNVALRAHDAACRRCHSDFDAANRDHDVKANRVSVCDFTSSFTSFVTYRENPLTPARTTAYYAIRNPALTDYNYAIKTATDNRLDAIRTAACDDTVAAAESTFNTVTAKALADSKLPLTAPTPPTMTN
ncbi:hypothetical protein AGMMS49531_11290 [Endomicrobiia bacterium]|nr:hypothetical protein AGMMS49531_11290 [Endomicrobiia bacterium]